MKRKLCVYLIIVNLFFIIYIHRNILETSLNIFNNNQIKLNKTKTEEKLKYILQWTLSKDVPARYMDMGVGQKIFQDFKCLYSNCYITTDRNLLKNYTNFDVIVFLGPELKKLTKDNLPKIRSPHQKYVFASMESAINYPSCEEHFNEFFNWTWTYKLDSDLIWASIAIRDKENEIIGPNKVMRWIKQEDMKPVPDKLKEILLKKKKAAAWFVSNCYTKSERELFVDKLRTILKSNFSLDVDIYGRCGNFHCPRDNDTACDEMIKNDYYFYLAFENSFAEDYVTEKLLRAVKFNAIPIVFGGANYSRFLPEGSYLNARELGADKLAAKMHELIKDKEQYIKFFKWTNHYSYHDRHDDCSMCAMINDDSKVKQTTTYKDFNIWWNAEGHGCGHKTSKVDVKENAKNQTAPSK